MMFVIDFNDEHHHLHFFKNRDVEISDVGSVFKPIDPFIVIEIIFYIVFKVLKKESLYLDVLKSY